MVQDHMVRRGIQSQRVLDAFAKVPREAFLPDDLADMAYVDSPVPIGEEQTISQPYIVALMTELLDLTGDEKVLEIGTGSGYQAAIIAELAKEVYSIERHAYLAKKAQQVFSRLGYTQITLKIDDGSLGWEEKAPFDRIIITAASPEIPPPLIEQLKEGGKLVLPLGDGFSQILTLATKKGNRIETSAVCSCIFVPLVGKYGCKPV